MATAGKKRTVSRPLFVFKPDGLTQQMILTRAFALAADLFAGVICLKGKDTPC
jgi:hypothetical protein